ncbi:unnamed protein product [Ambrosiozyma monospora]|uniref:Unnamed protein product n=1 Tax=Ambrosiozyma monospora TaxID=43982 RepID=A0ACB5SSV9_AMBMO|nr:unnamed protein product [Ambrosiozyma monospora]
MSVFLNQAFNSITTNTSPDTVYKLTTSEKRSLLEPFTLAGLSQLLSKMVSRGISAPGTDRISYTAWHKAWHLCGQPIVNLTNYLLLHGEILHNSTVGDVLIRLIPKKAYVASAPNTKDLRPISFGNSSFRLILNAIKERLTPIVQRLVGSTQQAFLPTRTIHRSIQTARMVASFIQQKPQSTESIFMIDLEKVFDRVRIECIDKLLAWFGFPDRIVSLLVSSQVCGKARLLNGKLIVEAPIPLRRGLRQGFGTSVITFNLAIEPLLRMIEQKLASILYCPLNNLGYFSSQTSEQITQAYSTKVKAQAYADDLAGYAKDFNDIKLTLELAKQFGSFSGLQTVKQRQIHCSH